MSVTQKAFLLAVVALGLAAVTRFYCLDWSVSASDDHIATFKEVRSLVQKPFFPENLERDDLQARSVPVGYALNAVSFRMFGTDEAGSRTGSAIAGALAIFLCVLLVAKLYGPVNAIMVAGMLILWPWQLLHSQSNRHYSYAFLFASLAILTTAVAWRLNSFRWGMLGGLLTGIAIATHTVMVIIPAGLLLFLVVETLVKRDQVRKRALWGYLTVGLPSIAASCALAVYFFWSFALGLATDAGWGRAPRLDSLIFNIGWSVSLLSAVGWILSWKDGEASDRICASVVVTAVLACVIAPLFTAFRADYVFPACVVFLVLAGRVLTRAYQSLRPTSRIAAVGVAAAAVMLPLPSFVSYYQDGDRPDYRAAASFIKARCQDGDLVAADDPGTMRYYLNIPVRSAGRPSTNAKGCVGILSEMAATGQRVWYVCRFAREEPPAEADRWMWKNAIRMLRVKRKRFDYHENILDVYLFNPTARDRERIEQEKP